MMERRRLGRTGLEVGVVSLGTEYLVEATRETVVEVVREAVAGGVSYFDVLFAYPHYRDNFGAAFEGLRDEIAVAGHLGVAEQDGQYRMTRDVRESEEIFDDLLRRLNTDRVDVLFLSNCDSEEDYERIFAPGGLADLANRLRKEGKARFIAFSGHTVATSRKAVESGAIDVLMHNVSLAGDATPGRTELHQLCASRDVGLIAMKPFAGGSLLLPDARPRVTPVQCLSYVLAQVGVATVVPGVKNLHELRAVLDYLDAAPDERDFSGLVGQFQDDVEGRCVYCNHCLPCPAGVDVGKVNRLMDAAAHGVGESLADDYAALDAKASDCTECGQCVERCPFDVDVVARMHRTAELFEKG